MYNGKTLLQHAIDTAVKTSAIKILVVLGCYSNVIKKELKGDVTIVFNEDWSEGMASSIVCGLKSLTTLFPVVDAVIFMVCDQPYISTEILNELVEEYIKTGKPIIASSYDNNLGIPALFDSSLFTKLLALKGDTGAKKIIAQNAESMCSINFPLGNIDIDTDAAYIALLQQPI